jgi:hypothetical protein
MERPNWSPDPILPVKPPEVALIFCSESTWAPSAPIPEDIAIIAVAATAVIQPFEAQRMARTLLDDT